MTDQQHPSHEHTLSAAIRAFAPRGMSIEFGQVPVAMTIFPSSQNTPESHMRILLPEPGYEPDSYDLFYQKHGPRAIAYLLLHELGHVYDFTTIAGGDDNGRDERSALYLNPEFPELNNILDDLYIDNAIYRRRAGLQSLFPDMQCAIVNRLRITNTTNQESSARKLSERAQYRNTVLSLGTLAIYNSLAVPTSAEGIRSVMQESFKQNLSDNVVKAVWQTMDYRSVSSSGESLRGNLLDIVKQIANPAARRRFYTEYIYPLYRSLAPDTHHDDAAGGCGHTLPSPEQLQQIVDFLKNNSAVANSILQTLSPTNTSSNKPNNELSKLIEALVSNSSHDEAQAVPVDQKPTRPNEHGLQDELVRKKLTAAGLDSEQIDTYMNVSRKVSPVVDELRRVLSILSAPANTTERWKNNLRGPLVASGSRPAPKAVVALGHGSTNPNIFYPKTRETVRLRPTFAGLQFHFVMDMSGSMRQSNDITHAGHTLVAMMQAINALMKEDQRTESEAVGMNILGFSDKVVQCLDMSATLDDATIAQAYNSYVGYDGGSTHCEPALSLVDQQLGNTQSKNIVFIVTDGTIHDFSLSRERVNALVQKGATVYHIQIGSSSKVGSLTDSSRTVTIHSARDLPAALQGVLTP